MSSPGTLRFAEVNTKPSAPPAGYNLLYIKTDDILYLQDSSGTEVALGSANVITSLSGEATGVGPGNAVVTLSNSAVIGKVLTGFVAGPNSPVLATDSILEAIQKLQAQVAGSVGTAITALTGDVSATGPGSVAATVNSVGGKSASDIAQSVTDTQAATSVNTASSIVKRDASGNFAANIITANITGNVSGSAGSFTGSLLGDVTGTQGATVVSLVGGKSAAAVAQSVTDTQAATSINTASTIVKRDASGNFAASVITAVTFIGDLTGNVTGNVSGSSASFTGSLAGDVTGTQGATSISSATVTAKLLTGLVPGVNTVITAANSILVAFENLQAQISASVGAAITALTGDVSATGPGSATATVNSVGGSSAANINSAELLVNAATSLNTANAIVRRDASGNFAAGLITATFSGNLTGNVTGNVSGTAGNITATTNSTLTTLTALSLPGSQVTGDIGGNAQNVNGTVAILHGGTGQTTANAGFNALSPMTTLGDIIYEDATPVAARLAGNITATRKFLSQTGNGTISAAPVWNALVSGDIPNNAANTTGTASNITATTNSTLTTLTALSLPTTQLSGTISLTTQVAGVLPIANGGTNNSSVYTAGSIIFSNGTSLTQDNSQLYWDDTAKALGIGTIPISTAVIDVVNNSGSTKAVQLTGYGSNIGFRGRRANGTLATPTNLVAGDVMTFISGRGYGASQFATASTGVISIVADGTFTNTSNPTYISFSVTPSASVTSVEAMRIASSGRVLIDTTVDNGSDYLQIGSGVISGYYKISGSTSGYVQLLAPAVTSTYNLTFPADGGTAGGVLTTDGFGTLSYSNPSANIDGGVASSVYIVGQFVNGGTP